MKKILVIRFSSIGDIILTTPVIRCIKQQLPDSEIHYLTKKRYLSIINENPYIDKIHVIDSKVAEVIQQLKAEQYNYIVDLHKNIRSCQVKLALGKRSSSFNKLNIQKWLLTRFKINLLPDIHLVERYFNAVRKLGVTYDKQGIDFYIPESEKISLSDYFPDSFCKRYIALVVGSKQKTKQLTVGKITELCIKLPFPVILLGDSEDNIKAGFVAETLPEKVFNACGLFTLNQSASVVEQSKLVITPDTGLMHIAAAFKKNIISVWGNTVPLFGMYPCFPEGRESYTVSEVKNLRCRPCSKLGYDKCPKGHFRCMEEINTDEIVIKSLQILKS